MHNQSDYGYPVGSSACRCCGAHERDCCPGTKEMRWDGSAKVWEVFLIRSPDSHYNDLNEWLGAYDTRAEALAVVRA